MPTVDEINDPQNKALWDKLLNGACYRCEHDHSQDVALFNWGWHYQKSEVGKCLECGDPIYEYGPPEDGIVDV